MDTSEAATMEEVAISSGDSNKYVKRLCSFGDQFIHWLGSAALCYLAITIPLRFVDHLPR